MILDVIVFREERQSRGRNRVVFNVDQLRAVNIRNNLIPEPATICVAAKYRGSFQCAELAQLRVLVGENSIRAS